MQSKVNWYEAPDWANYWAMDGDGNAYWYRKEPEALWEDSMWNAYDPLDDAPSFGFSAHQWRYSLTKRTEESKPDQEKAPDELVRDAEELGLYDDTPANDLNGPTELVDWSKAPDWAQYWAMDSDGDAFWYEKSPLIDEPDGVWTAFVDTFGGALKEFASEFAPTYGVSPENWKQSLSARWACERDRKTSCGRDEVMSNTIVFSEDSMTTEVTRTSDKIKVRAGDGYAYGVDELCTLDDTGNGFIAKFHSNSSMEQPIYFSLDYSHAAYLLMALLTEYRLGDTFGKMEVRRPAEESKK